MVQVVGRNEMLIDCLETPRLEITLTNNSEQVARIKNTFSGNLGSDKSLGSGKSTLPPCPYLSIPTVLRKKKMIERSGVICFLLCEILCTRVSAPINNSVMSSE